MYNDVSVPFYQSTRTLEKADAQWERISVERVLKTLFDSKDGYDYETSEDEIFWLFLICVLHMKSITFNS